jgi:hypothetical protein
MPYTKCPLLFIIFKQYHILCVQTVKGNLADDLQGCEQAKENHLNFRLLTRLQDIVHILYSVSAIFIGIPLIIL